MKWFNQIKTLVKQTAMRNIRFKIENIFNGINENNLNVDQSLSEHTSGNVQGKNINVQGYTEALFLVT